MGARILRRRKEKGLTQEALANKLGVSNQAVSKWEGDVCCPDLQLLPLLADTLELSLDELFGRESMAKAAQKAEADSQILPIAAELPWEDDDAIHAVLFQGHRLLQPKQGSLFRHDKYDEIRKTVELHFSGTAQDIYSDFSVVCTDSTISGSVRAGDGVTCTDVGGDVTAGDDVTCGNVGGDVSASDSVRCGEVKGNVRASDSVTCGDISGSVSAERVRCTKAGGEEQESFTFTKKGKSFSFPLR
jgi:transcriptional regulator with XRE-family HTH domain/cytoskeletal protein CcmA (bactofilin family)